MAPRRTIGLDCGAVRAQQVMRCDRSLEAVAMSWRQGPMQIAAIRNDPGLIQRHPFFYAAVELAKHDLSVVGKPLRYLGIEPSAAIVECCRRGPNEKA